MIYLVCCKAKGRASFPFLLSFPHCLFAHKEAKPPQKLGCHHSRRLPTTASRCGRLGMYLKTHPECISPPLHFSQYNFPPPSQPELPVLVYWDDHPLLLAGWPVANPTPERPVLVPSTGFVRRARFCSPANPIALLLFLIPRDKLATSLRLARIVSGARY